MSNDLSHMTDESEDQTSKQLRWAIYVILIALSLGQAAGKILSVNDHRLTYIEHNRINRAVEKERVTLEASGREGEALEEELIAKKAELKQKMRLQRPFLSANDRSRWLAVRALVETGSFAIEPILVEPTWDTIDMVKHVGRDGEEHLYSSKPVLLITLLAIPYWFVVQLTGMTLGTHPYEIGRSLLLLINSSALAIFLLGSSFLAERLGRNNLDRITLVAAAAFGTMLSAFVPVLNNHLIATASIMVALVGWIRLIGSNEPMPGTSLLVGLASAFGAANELPALSFVGLVACSLLLRRPKETLVWFLPGALLVGIAFFGTNYWSHNTIWPPYAYRHADSPDQNWYDYEYTINGKTRVSHWRNPSGVDRGEASKATYAIHTLVGHHGIFSLTPYWLLSLGGIWAWLAKGDRPRREIAFATLTVTVVCLYFFVMMRPQIDRNYGGMTSGFRWMFWVAPLWLATALPVVHWLEKRKWGLALVGVLLFFSVLSASYPTWNPWSPPWIHAWLSHLGFEVL